LSEPVYDERYSRPGLYWGSQPTRLARDVVRIARTLPRSPRTWVDLGSGEGRDSIYFARQGYRALGVDISSVGVQKAKRRASRLGVNVRFLVGDIRTYQLSHRVDVLFCSGALNNLPRRIRASRFEHFKASTAPGGINAMNADVPKPYIPPQSTNPFATPFRSGELLGYYWDWQILDSGQGEFISNSGGVPHRKAMDVVIARKPAPGSY
jgi:tellurite methyltransferase